MMKNIFKTSFLLLVCTGMAFWGCQELGTVNVNSPDEERALQNPSDVESLIGGSYFTFHNALYGFGYPDESLETAADYLTYSWGNYGSNELSHEPRAPIPNSTSWGYRGFVTRPWFDLYGVISSCNDGLRAISGGLEIDELDRAKAFAKFMQGMSHAMLGVLFDQAFIFDENVNLDTDILELKPYQEVFAAGKAEMEEAISIMESSSFTLPESWIRGNAFTSAELAQLAHSLLANYMAMVPRDPAERLAVNWNEVLTHLDKGMTTDFTVLDEAGQWWHSMQSFHSNSVGATTTWGRADYKMIGSSDRSNGYQTWLNLPVAQRDDFEMDTADLRIWDQTRDASGNQNPGLYFYNNGNARFNADRGTYHHSMYASHRYAAYQANNDTGPMYMLLTTQNDFLRAEALLHIGGREQEVADIINSTRVTNGGLEPATVADGAGSMSDERKALKPASLWAMMKYDKAIETTITFCGTGFCDRRGWGELVSGTFLHLPIPANEMQTLQLQVYTFGGGGPGSAPKLSESKDTPPE